MRLIHPDGPARPTNASSNCRRVHGHLFLSENWPLHGSTLDRPVVADHGAHEAPGLPTIDTALIRIGDGIARQWHRVSLDELEQISESSDVGTVDLMLLKCDWGAVDVLDRAIQLRRHWPDSRWILVGTFASPSDAAAIVLRLKVLGWLDPGAPLELLNRAIDAVSAGRTWFPRALAGELCLAALSPEALSTTGHDDIDLLLSPREREVHALTRQGMSNKEIARALGVSVNTVKKHMVKVFEKKGLRKRRQVLA